MKTLTLDLSASLKEAPNKREILRYMGCREASAEVEALVDACIDECGGAFAARVCYAETDIASCGDNAVCFEFAEAVSAALAKNIRGCDGAVVFAATVGIEIDRLVAKYGRISPSKAVALQALGAERIEAVCDAFCNELKKKYAVVRPRFSPGYGDLSLEFQRELFSVLDCPRKIGLTLNDSLLMSPTKSVTAIVGICR